MESQAIIQKQQIRMACEVRLGRRLSDQEFERVLYMGNGVFWDYKRGVIDPYDLATLQSRQQMVIEWGGSQHPTKTTTTLPFYAYSSSSFSHNHNNVATS